MNPKCLYSLWLDFSGMKKITAFQRSPFCTTKDLSQRNFPNIEPSSTSLSLSPWFLVVYSGRIKKSNVTSFSCDSSSSIWRQQLHSHTVFYFAGKKTQNSILKWICQITCSNPICRSSLREGTQEDVWLTRS